MPGSYKHVLLTTDLTPDSEVVAQKAAEIAKLYNAKLSIFHAVQEPRMFYGGGEFAVPVDLGLEEDIEQAARRELNKQAEKFEIGPADRWLEIGLTKESILNIVQQLNIDLLVIGNHEAQGLAFLFGSVTDAIMHKISCDVLAVRLK